MTNTRPHERSDERKPPLRKNVNWTVSDRISNRKCLHIDAWFIQDTNDDLYFLIEYRAGGWVVLQRKLFRTQLHEAMMEVPFDEGLITRGMARHVDSPWARKYAPWARHIHSDYILPAISAPMPPFHGYRSIVLHYVWSDPTIDDPFAGIVNMYATTPRGERDAGMMSAERRAEVEAARVPTMRERTRNNGKAWSAKDRSILRTLDKLLK